MKVAKPDEKDFDTTHELLQACELVLEKEKWGFKDPQDNWEDLDEDDLDRKIILNIRKQISEEEDVSIDHVDMRIVMYEFLRRKFAKASCNWRRVYWAATILMENTTDPTEDVLAFHPGIELYHVANEQ